MNRVSLIILSIVFITSACQEDQPSIQKNYENQIEGLNDLYSASLNTISSQFGNISYNAVDEVSSMTKNVIVHSAEFIDTQYFIDHEFSKNEIDLIAENSTSLLTSNSSARILHSGLIDNGYYTPEQIELLEPFIEQLLSDNFLSNAKQVVESFNQIVINSDLSNERKFELLSVGAAAKASADFLNNGGVHVIASELDIAYSSNGRVLGCSVSSRNVLASAVVGLAGGAATGGYVGATAGTFTVPILGTAAGGVGGAVFGGAAGFVGGLISGVAAELITSCGR